MGRRWTLEVVQIRTARGDWTLSAEGLALANQGPIQNEMLDDEVLALIAGDIGKVVLTRTR